MNNYPTVSAAVIPTYRDAAKIPEEMTIEQNGQIEDENGTGNWYLIPYHSDDNYDCLPDLTTIPVMNGSTNVNVMAYKFSAPIKDPNGEGKPGYYIAAMTDELWHIFSTVTKYVTKAAASDCGCSGAGTSFRLGTI